MTTFDLALPAAPARPAIWPAGLVGGVFWVAAAAVTWYWPTFEEDWAYTAELAIVMAALGVALLVAGLGARLHGRLGPRLHRIGPWAVALAVLFGAWEIATAKLGLLPRPFFAPPQALLEVYLDDWQRLGISAAHSLALLGSGYLIGAVLGFLTGIAIGWSQAIGYWVHPVLRLIGPLPATAWLPIAFFAFPTSGSASVFLIALATGFPVTILTWSGIASVNRAYYDIARTLGASPAFLVFKVAIPGAMPHVFVGLFMGLGTSFSVLITAEMLGVKAGLGWYLTWAQGWAAYANMYGALLLMAAICSGLITLLFRLRDHLLAWQKGLVKW